MEESEARKKLRHERAHGSAAGPGRPRTCLTYALQASGCFSLEALEKQGRARFVQGGYLGQASFAARVSSSVS